MHDALEKLLGDAALHAKLEANAEIIQKRDGLAIGAQVIEQAARSHKK
jgi:UDP:flavonoid glycosyltransferase YjiC (YdhE family)